MWEITLSLQTRSFLFALITGSIFCLLFETYQIALKPVKQNRAGVFICDVLFFLAFGFFDFCFFLSLTNGEVRGYVFFGQIIGFYIAKKTAAKYFSIFLQIVLRPIFRFFLFLKRGIFTRSLLNLRKKLTFVKKTSPNKQKMRKNA